MIIGFGFGIECNEVNCVYFGDGLLVGFDGDLSCFVYWVVVDFGRDGWKSNGLCVDFVGYV